LAKMGDTERRLVAIFAADVEGFSRLMGTDEVGTLRDLTQRRDVLDGLIASRRGRIANTAGDSVLAEFGSAVDAVQCAVEAQAALSEANAGLSPDRQINFRIGVHVGDVMIKGGDLFGDGVNIAARLQTLASAGGVCLSGVAYDQVRKILHFAFADLGAQRVKNIDEPVRAFALVADRMAVVTASANASVPLALPDKPSIAVLPFQNMSADPDQEYFADGLVEDIITALSRYNSLFVIARNSSFTYKGKAVDIKQVGRELGVRYVLEGSVRKAGSRLRITGQLIEASTGSHLWAERFDGALEDVFELQDKVASSVAGVIDPVLLEAEIKRASNRPTVDLTAYDLCLRALPLLRSWAAEPIVKAIDLVNQAIERDPRFGFALALLAFCHSQNVWSGWGEDSAAESERGRALARRALESAPDDPATVFMAAGALMNLGDDVRVLKGLVDNAVARNPSAAYGWFWSGWMRTFSGEADPAIEHFETSLRLDPRTTRRAFHLTGVGICHFFQRRFDQAAAVLEASFHELPTYPTTTWFLASCYAQMGRVNEAREFAARQGIRPGGPWLKRVSLFRKPEHQELLLTGLRLATGEQV
jgi:adenylate cyclase